MEICWKLSELLVSQQSLDDDTFEEGSHTVSSEPHTYFHDVAYKDLALEEVTIIDCKSRRLATEVNHL